MSPQPASPTLRESLGELGTRLDRIGAAASTLRGVSGEIRHGVPPAMLLTQLEQLERDLALAALELSRVQERAAREMTSLSGTPPREE
jgi:hypothetical protein